MIKVVYEKKQKKANRKVEQMLKVAKKKKENEFKEQKDLGKELKEFQKVVTGDRKQLTTSSVKISKMNRTLKKEKEKSSVRFQNYKGDSTVTLLFLYISVLHLYSYPSHQMLNCQMAIS